MENKLISINITTFNRSTLIRRCLDSILNQTYKNIEVNIADDCSTDNTEEVIKEYMEKDSRIYYYKHEKNQGNAYARNTALKNTNGYYVAFMDDDDEWIDKKKLEKQYEIFENSDERLGIICSNPRIYTSKSEFKDKIIQKPKNLKEAILKGNSMIYNSTCFTKKSIMEEVGGFDLRVKKGVDSDFFRFMIVKLNYNIYFMQEVNTAVYEFGEDRMTTDKSKNKLKLLRNTNLYLMKKYLRNYLQEPKATIKRLTNILRIQYQIWSLK